MNSRPSFTRAEADHIIALIKEKLKANTEKQKTIRGKIRRLGFYASDYGFRDGYTVEQFLRVAKIIGANPAISKMPTSSPTVQTNKPVQVNKRTNSDEAYIIDLCDEVLKQKAIRQHRFDFLRGDSGTKLPVDAWYPQLNLVVEYRERQHTEEVKFFDKRITTSGKTRGEQRKAYDELRRKELPKHGIKLIELDYSDFEHTSGKRLVRDKMEDLKVIMKKLKK